MKKLLALVVIIILTFVLISSWWGSQLSAVSADKTTQLFLITKGQSLVDIADSLQKKFLIRSSQAFKLYVKKQGLESKIQTGTFEVSPSQTSKEIAITLTNQPKESWVTLLEGWRVEEIAEKLNKDLGINNKDFLDVVREGYMFPDTYLFPKDVTVETIVAALRKNFEKKYSEQLKSKIRQQGLTPDQGVILASIVEREARSDEARTMVASILLKRFKIGMGLNVDASIQYALGYQKDEKSWWKRHLTREDLKIDSPYNTYIHSGLPLTPICNPGLSSLQAVADADSSTPYLYYYHDSKGVSHYGKTLDEHNANVANYP